MLLPAGLVLAVPIAVVNAILHRGQPFFAQTRVGQHGREFRIWKFRTMKSPTSRLPATNVAEPRLGAHAEEANAFERWSAGDGQVTRFGRWLRDTHLDELPQLWNVLVGDMDLVGPRPEMVAVHRWAESEIPEFSERDIVRPGLTGLAQITLGYAGRDVEAYRAKLEVDLEYLARPSLWRDLALVGRTGWWLFRSLPSRSTRKLAR